MNAEGQEKPAPPAHAPARQGPSWSGFAKTCVLNFVIILITTCVKDKVFKFDNYLLQCAIYASFLVFFNLLYQRLQ